MEANWIVVGIVLIAAILLVVHLFRQNQKDRREYEDYLNNQSKPKNETDVGDGL
ncbi:hypothetical protein [Flavobacterium selenitireducens]|uniref:hypothetical protein n=1 Tax=Flavobacterium selenitireducens TaxID=2722704 RepID=UPI00168BB97A|nr:hypothetical protein [Flavobacterium selenitireducens]MBD3582539.1 hypothetical protein [Flavobacterium selenitireducens]